MAFDLQSSWRAFSFAKQADIATAATVDTRVAFEGDVTGIDWDKRHSDRKKMTGTPLATKNKGLTKKHEFSHKDDLTPHVAALFGAMVIGNCTSSALTGAAKRHRMMPSNATKELPYRTMVEFDGETTTRYTGVACKKLKISGRRADVATMEAEMVSAAVEASSVLTAPALVSESWLDYSNCQVSRGFTWDGSAISGGTAMNLQLVSFDFEMGNNAFAHYQMGRGETGRGPGKVDRGDDGFYATLKGVALKESASTPIRDAYLNETEITFALPIIGETIAGSDAYMVRVLFPRAKVTMAKKVNTEGGNLGLEFEIEPLHEDTYKGLVFDVVNTQASYL